ncbi:MAG: PhnD/SsuA/transferrin family substrate-binding protein [Planctomycetota bacterium]
MPPRTALVPALLLLAACGGCQSVSQRFLSVVGLQQRPLSVALVDNDPAPAARLLNPFPAYEPLQRALAEELHRPVAVDVCFCFQAERGLANGWYDLAVLTPGQYARLPLAHSLRVLALPIDERGGAAEQGLLIVRADSPIAGPTELRGKVVVFGPAGDTLTHVAALARLRRDGLRPQDLQLDLLPIPNSLRHRPDAAAVAREILSGSAAAGFVREADWAAWPATAAAPEAAARDRLRIIARTLRLPRHLVIAGPALDAETAERIRDFLLHTDTRHTRALAALGLAGYSEPNAELVAACRGLSEQPTPESHPSSTAQRP